MEAGKVQQTPPDPKASPNEKVPSSRLHTNTGSCTNGAKHETNVSPEKNSA